MTKRPSIATAIVLAASVLAGCAGRDVSIPTPLGPVTSTVPDEPAEPAAPIAAGPSNRASETASAVTVGDADGPVIVITGGEITERAVLAALGDDTETTESDNPPHGTGTVPDLAPAEPDAVGIVLPSIVRHEGYSREVYNLADIDHYCYGHRLRSYERGLPPPTGEECDEIAAEDIATAFGDARVFVGGEAAFEALTSVRRAGLVELAYILGRPKLLDFGDGELRRAVQAGDWAAAIDVLWQSRLPLDDGTQLGPDRVQALAEMLQ